MRYVLALVICVVPFHMYVCVAILMVCRVYFTEMCNIYASIEENYSGKAASFLAQ